MDIKIYHYEWNDTLKIENQKIIRKFNNDCGYFNLNNKVLEIDWEIWGKEYFYSKNNNNVYYSCEKIEIGDFICYVDYINKLVYRLPDNLFGTFIDKDNIRWDNDETSVILDNKNNDKNNNDLNNLNEDNQLSSKIPNIIHFIFGLIPQEEEFHLYRYLSVKSAYEVNKPDIIYFYYHYEPYGEWWEKTKEIVKLEKVDLPDKIFGNHLNHYAHKCDVIRLEKIIERGGIYLDIDTICVKSFSDLLDTNHFVMGAQGSYNDLDKIYGLCNAVMLSVPQSKFALKWYNSYKTFRSTGRDENWDEHSVIMPLRLYEKYPNEITVINYNSFFYPMWDDIEGILFNGKIDNGEYEKIIKNNYCIHLWDTYTHNILKTYTEKSIFEKNSIYNIFARKFLRNKISLVFLTYNRNDMTIKCLNSYLPALDREDIKEIIILDNNSNAELKDYLKRFEKMNKKIKIIFSNKNLGVCIGRKILFKEAVGDIIISLDSDAFLENQIFFDVIKEKLYNENIGIVGISGAFLKSWEFGTQMDIKDDDEGEYYCDHIAGCCQAFRRDMFLLGVDLDSYYDKFWVEDTDFSMQFLKLGKRNYRIPQKDRMKHNWGGSGSEFSDLFEKHWNYFVKKWKGKVLMP